MSKPRTINHLPPEVYMMYDTSGEQFLCGAKGQTAFGDIGTLKRSYGHCSWRGEVLVHAKMREAGFSQILTDLREAEEASNKKWKELTKKGYYHGAHADHQNSFEFLTQLKIREEYIKLYNKFRPSVTVGAFSKQNVVVIVQITAMESIVVE